MSDVAKTTIVPKTQISATRAARVDTIISAPLDAEEKVSVVLLGRMPIVSPSLEMQLFASLDAIMTMIVVVSMHVAKVDARSGENAA